MSIRSRFGLVGIMALAAACNHGAKRPKPATTSASPELIRTLAVLATGRTLSAAEIDGVKQDIDRGRLTFARYIDRLVTSNEFAADIAPLIIIREFLSQDPYGAPLGYTLSKTAGAEPIYYLYDPCKPADAVSVQPWWNLAAGRHDSIKVCRDSYVPDRWDVERPAGQEPAACLSYLSPGPADKRCGCGPNLIRCFESDTQFTSMQESMRSELRRSVEYNVRHDLPVGNIFTSNETWRDRNVETLLQMLTAEAKHAPIPDRVFAELAAWPADGKWTPREDLAPGQNAGILTTQQIVQYQVDRRQRMTAIYDVLWCIDPDSVGASPEAALSVAAKSGANLQLSSDGWKDLAARPVCTNCHARLDYGFQFFWGYPNTNVSAFFTPALQKKERGPLYGRDISDSRGEAALTPSGFAQLAIAQPEFNRCVARDFAEYALGNRVSEEQIASLQATVQPGRTRMRDVMRAALGLVVDSWAKGSHVPDVPTAAVAKGRVAITSEMHELLDKECLDCHDHQDGRPDLSAKQLDRTTVVEVLEAVSSGRMPKDQPMHGPERSAFLDAFIGKMWAGADATEARRYYVDRFMSIAAYRPEVALALIHRIAKSTVAHNLDWRMVENGQRSDSQQLSPGFIGVTALMAIEACRDAKKSRAEKDACIASALKLENLGRDSQQAPATK
jgi:hypothetical protein